MMKLDYTFSDIVKICIEKIYTRDTKNKFLNLCNFVDKYKEKLKANSDTELFLIYKGFLFLLADQELARQYAIADPIGAKIHRNILECLKKNKKLKLIKDYRGCIVQLNNHESSDHLPKFPVELLENEIFNRLNHQQLITPYLLDILYSIFKENKSFHPSVLLIELIQIFKKIQSYETVNIEDNQATFDCDNLTSYDIQVVRNEVELELKQKLIFTYYRSGKLNKKEIEAFFNAFKDMFDDWCEKFDTGESLYDYLNRYLPITRAEFEDKYRSKIEYLLKIAREEFRNRLMRDL